MKLGLLSSILDGFAFEEAIDFAAAQGFSCVELAAWKKEKAKRRYAGVSHIDAEGLTQEKAKYILDYCSMRGIELSSLAYYPNPLDPDPEEREAAVRHLISVIDASARLGVNMVTTFIGRDQYKTADENLKEAEKVWKPIMAHAEEAGVRVAIENCPMLFGPDQWPGGQNIMTTPQLWRRVLDAVGSDMLGINFDPSHFVWQMLDYIAPVYEFKDRIFHVHIKDIKLYPEKLKRAGTMAYPLEYMQPKLPGLGDVDWSAFISALTDTGYDSFACIEVEDRAFEASRERIEQSIILSKRYIEQFII